MDYLEALGELARRAGAAIMEIYERGDLGATTKADDSPLTRADLAAHDIIMQGLKQLAPQVPALSEESPPIPLAERASWREYFLVDPLDGTKEFLSRNGEFTVNIALIQQGEPTQGIVYAPAKGVLYAGSKPARQAYKEDAAGSRRPIATRQLGGALVVVASRRHGGEALASLRQRLEAQFPEVRTQAMGSSLKFCLIAEGKADLYPRLAPTAIWDTAAAQAVLEAAGGQALDAALKPLAYPMTERMLNPHFYALGDPAPWPKILQPAKIS